jgi:hypothetical protein
MHDLSHCSLDGSQAQVLFVVASSSVAESAEGKLDRGPLKPCLQAGHAGIAVH